MCVPFLKSNVWFFDIMMDRKPLMASFHVAEYRGHPETFSRIHFRAKPGCNFLEFSRMILGGVCHASLHTRVFCETSTSVFAVVVNSVELNGGNLRLAGLRLCKRSYSSCRNPRRSVVNRYARQLPHPTHHRTFFLFSSSRTFALVSHNLILILFRIYYTIYYI